MGGKGSGYPIRLFLTKEMRIALTKLTADEESPRDFDIALKIVRAGLIVYGVLGSEDLQSMYRRKLISDDEAQFLLEEGLVKEDFRPIKIEAIHQAQERKLLNNQFRDAIEGWNELKESAKIYWHSHARKYSDLPNAQRLLKLVKEAKQ